MKTERKAALALYLLMAGALGVGFWTIDRWQPDEPSRAPEEEAASQLSLGALSLPAVSAASQAPHQVDLAAWQGRPVLVNFWASWCSACREERAALEQLRGTHPAAMVGIATADKAGAVEASEKLHAHGYPIALDVDGSAASRFGIDALPQTLIFDANGRLLRRFRGPLSSFDLSLAESLLRTPKS